jgi:hypothetical protein
VRWTTVRELGSPWASKSDDGYYAITPGAPFEAHHISALWAKPVKIGESVTLELAQQLCEHHATLPRVF